MSIPPQMANIAIPFSAVTISDPSLPPPLPPVIGCPNGYGRTTSGYKMIFGLCHVEDPTFGSYKMSCDDTTKTVTAFYYDDMSCTQPAIDAQSGNPVTMDVTLTYFNDAQNQLHCTPTESPECDYILYNQWNPTTSTCGLITDSSAKNITTIALTSWDFPINSCYQPSWTTTDSEYTELKTCTPDYDVNDEVVITESQYFVNSASCSTTPNPYTSKLETHGPLSSGDDNGDGTRTCRQLVECSQGYQQSVDQQNAVNNQPPLDPNANVNNQTPLHPYANMNDPPLDPNANTPQPNGMSCYNSIAMEVSDSDKVDCVGQEDRCVFNTKHGQNYWRRTCSTQDSCPPNGVDVDEYGCKTFTQNNANVTLCCCTTPDCNGNQYHTQSLLGSSTESPTKSPTKAPTNKQYATPKAQNHGHKKDSSYFRVDNSESESKSNIIETVAAIFIGIISVIII